MKESLEYSGYRFFNTENTTINLNKGFSYHIKTKGETTETHNQKNQTVNYPLLFLQAHPMTNDSLLSLTNCTFGRQ